MSGWGRLFDENMEAEAPQVERLIEGKQASGTDQGTDRKQGTIVLKRGKRLQGMWAPAGMEECIRIRVGRGLNHPVGEQPCPVASLGVMLVMLKRTEIVDEASASDPEIGTGQNRPQAFTPLPPSGRILGLREAERENRTLRIRPEKAQGKPDPVIQRSLRHTRHLMTHHLAQLPSEFAGKRCILWRSPVGGVAIWGETEKIVGNPA
jgi:hypothetical protein